MGREQKDVTFREAGGFLKPRVERGAVMGSARPAGGRENGLRETLLWVPYSPFIVRDAGLELLQRASGYLSPSLMPTSLAQNGPHGT